MFSKFDERCSYFDPANGDNREFRVNNIVYFERKYHFDTGIVAYIEKSGNITVGTFLIPIVWNYPTNDFAFVESENKAVFLQVTDSTSAHNYSSLVLYGDAKIFSPECIVEEYCIVHRSRRRVPPVSENILVDWERIFVYKRKRGGQFFDIALETSNLN